MDDDRSIRVGLVGYGLAGEAFHAPLIAATRGLALTAIVTRDPARRGRAATRYPDARLLDSPGELWAGAVDVAVVATPNRSHAGLARAAIAAGVPVVVDKPLARSGDEAADVATASEAAGVMLTVFQSRRWDGDYLTVRSLIESGSLGSVARLESRFERWRPTVADGWREDGDPDAGGGVLLDLGSHLVDQAVQLFGPVAGVYAELDTRRAGAHTDDDAFVALAHASGVRSHLWMSAVAGQGGPRFRVLGDRAAYVTYGLDVQEAALREGAVPGGPGWGAVPPERWGLVGTDGQASVAPTIPGSYPTFYERLAVALSDGGPPPVDPWEAVAVMRILDAARVSSRDRRTVRPQDDASTKVTNPP